MDTEIKIPKRILNTLLSSLTAGVVPRIGAPYIAIGRGEEINSLLDNLEQIADGGAACRFLIGRYGSGKSFLIQLIRGRALDMGFITMDADLSPERRLCGGQGSGIATYRELIKNIATKSSPDGGALNIILSKYYSSLTQELLKDGIYPEDVRFADILTSKISSLLYDLEGDIGGFDFARVLGEYYRATLRDDEAARSSCLRWFRGEYANKTEAINSLGFRISTVINDDNWYDFIKLFSSLCVRMGYRGLVIFIDECVNLYKIPNRIAREANYEKILSIFNDTLQGKAKNMGVIFGGTPQFLEDTRRGLFSYDALKSRLIDSRYAACGYQNLFSPVIRLRALSENELIALVKRLTVLFSMKEGMAIDVEDSDITRFISQAISRVGAGTLATPREIIRDYLTILNILKTNPKATFSEILRSGVPSESENTPGDETQYSTNDSSINKIGIFDIEI